MLDRLFPYRQYRSVRLYYVLTLLLNSWFIAGVWYFVWRHFLTNMQIGISDGITFSAGFLFELPSGVWADFVGRHRAVQLGFAGMTIGGLVATFGSSFWVITLGFLIWTFGFTFQSGALDALVYDDLLRREPDTIDDSWPHVIARAQQYDKVMTMICTLFGALLYVWWFRLPFLAFSLAAFVGLLVALRLPADVPQDHEHKAWHLAAYRGQIGQGLRVILAREVRVVAVLALLIGALDYVLSWGILRPLIGVRFGFTASTLPMLQVVGAIAIVVALAFAAKRLKAQRSIGRFIGVTALVYGASFVAMGLTHNRWFGGALYVVVEVVSIVAAVGFSIFINHHTKSQHRATTLSSVSLLQRTPYAFLAVLLGWLAGKGLVGVFCLVAGLVVVASSLTLLPRWFVREQNAKRL